MLNLSCASDIQGRELYQCDFMKYAFDIVMCQDTFELLRFKLGKMLNTIKLYTLIFNLIDLDVHSRSQGYGKAGM